MKTIQVNMTLLSDTIFGSGRSVPGQEDISVLRDADGFPYYRGSTFKGIFREELERYTRWAGLYKPDPEGDGTENPGKENPVVRRLLGSNRGVGERSGCMAFSDFMLPGSVKHFVLGELGEGSAEEVLDACTHLRAFTQISEDGTAEHGTLRIARCVNRGLVFQSRISMPEEDEELVREVLSMIKWIGTMRNRGFGKVRIQ
ncbi:MAG: RAMP superfamily CRISPR-associated protein [Eubacteriales bacterium]|nr:RAMP superfamily CRISPR-associated protein [Eubacteriales bacterium]